MVSQYRKNNKVNKKELILKSARDIFSRYGFHRATIDMIANRARIAKGTIYLYFSSKIELFVSLLEKEFDSLVEKLRKSVEEEKEPIGKIEKGISAFFEYIENNIEFFITLMYEPPVLKRQIPIKKFLKKREELQQFIAGIIREGIRMKIFKNLNMDVMVNFVIGTLRGIVMNQILSGNREPLKKKIPDIMEIIKNGILLKEA